MSYEDITLPELLETYKAYTWMEFQQRLNMAIEVCAASRSWQSAKAFDRLKIETVWAFHDILYETRQNFVDAAGASDILRIESPIIGVPSVAGGVKAIALKDAYNASQGDTQ